MRIIVTALKKNLSPNNYAENIFFQLKEIAAQRSFAIIETDSFSIKTKHLPDHFLLCILREENSALKKIFDETQLSFLIKKTDADIVFNFEDNIYRSLKVPQIMAFHQEKNFGKKFIGENNFVFAFCEADKKNLSERKLFVEENIKLLYPSANISYKKAGAEERILFKEKYTENKEFFYSFFRDDEKEFLHILKAFSVFKKWQRSNMKLVLSYFSDAVNENFSKKLSTYKYRDDVMLMNYSDEKTNAEIMRCAYAFLYFESENRNVVMLANALQSHIPVITFENEMLKELCGTAAVYTENISPEHAGKQIVLLYKDESLRNELISKISNEVAKFSSKRNEKMLWDLMNLITQS